MQMINNFNDGRGNFQFFTMKGDPSLKFLTEKLTDQESVVLGN